MLWQPGKLQYPQAVLSFFGVKIMYPEAYTQQGWGRGPFPPHFRLVVPKTLIAELFKANLILQHWGLFDICFKGCWKGLSTSNYLGIPRVCARPDRLASMVSFPTIHGLVWSSKASCSALRVDSDISCLLASSVNQHVYLKSWFVWDWLVPWQR